MVARDRKGVVDPRCSRRGARSSPASGRHARAAQPRHQLGLLVVTEAPGRVRPFGAGCIRGCRGDIRRPERRNLRRGLLRHRLLPISSAERDPDRLLLGVLLERLEALVAAAEARLLVAAERRRDVALGVGVHADRAGAERPRDADRRVEVRRVHRGREAVAWSRWRGAIASSSVVERDRSRCTGPKISSRAIVIVLRDVVEDRRRDEVAAGPRQRPLAAGRRPVRPRPAPSRCSRGPCRGAAARPSGRGGSLAPSGRRPARPRGPSTSRSTSVVVDRAVDDQARPAEQFSPMFMSAGEEDLLGDAVEVRRIGEHDLRALAAASRARSP